MTSTIHRFEPVTVRLWRLLTERPGRYTVAELKRELHTSKTKILAALANLEEARLISTEEEE